MDQSLIVDLLSARVIHRLVPGVALRGVTAQRLNAPGYLINVRHDHLLRAKGTAVT